MLNTFIYIRPRIVHLYFFTPLVDHECVGLSQWLSVTFNPEKQVHALIERYTPKVHYRLSFLFKLCLNIRIVIINKHSFGLLLLSL